MTNGNGTNGFQYSYSAKEQEEIKKIRAKYLEKEEETSLEKVRSIDNAVTNRATVFALIFGIMGALIMGLGMSFIMTELSEALGSLAMPIGIILGIIGAACAAFAYPIYCLLLKKGREKAAPEIIRLTEELMKK